jgi:predicted class III extradiol MEMO1 family dioxygenase
MSYISLNPKSDKTASKAHSDFAKYLKATKNTICGRHPIGVLLAAAAELQDQTKEGWGVDQVELNWTRYEHSSDCETIHDSSVSYASAYLRCGA